MIEIHTGHYADTQGAEQAAELARIVRATEYGSALGLVVNAGHGLNLANVAPIAAIAQMEELNIGHALIGDAVFVGLDSAVRQMKAAMLAARAGQGA